ncbi:MAG: glycosyltransferase [Sedimenticola sp.]
MKIAFQKVPQWEGYPHAEAELASRMLIAVNSIDTMEGIATSCMDEIASFEPNVVVPLHFFLPKVFDSFTVGCMWNPVNSIEHNNAWDNIKSYDGYGIASEQQEQLVRSLKFTSTSPYLLTRLYPSTNTTTFNIPKTFGAPVYIGSNWSMDRHKDLFTVTKNIKVFGPRNRWKHLANGVYRGEIPVDGSSTLGAYHESGIGLSLHHADHNIEGIPSMRPFEIAASGSVMISDHNKFVKENFGDNALYIDTSLAPKEIDEQLTVLVDWIKSNQKQARDMARACHEIFIERYSLEMLLNNLVEDIDDFRRPDNASFPDNTPVVQIVIRSDGSDRKKLYRALSSIEQQIYKNVSALLVYRGMSEELGQLKNEIQKILPDLNIDYICTNTRCDRGAQFFTGLRACTAPYIGFLDHDDVIFSDHIEVLLACLTRNLDVSLSYSGSVRVWEDGDPPKDEQSRKLAFYYEHEKTQALKSGITSNSYLVRRDKIPWEALNQPIPRMNCREDFLFLNMMHDRYADFIFSGKVTCSFYWRSSKKDNCAFEKHIWDDNKKTFDLMRNKATTVMTYAVTSDSSRIEMYRIFKKATSMLRSDVINITKRMKNRLLGTS